MSEVVVCAACGARNPVDVRWCGQCYATIEPPAGDVAPPVASSPPVDTQRAPTGPAAEPVWTCMVCETVNSVESSVCSACGSSIFESFGAGGEPALAVDPGSALLRGLLLPGLGLLVVRRGATGAAIGGLALLSGAFGAVLMGSGMFPYGLFLVLLAAGIWLLAALDAYRVAEGAETEVVLRPKVLTVLVGVVVSVVILAVMSAQGRGGGG